MTNAAKNGVTLVVSFTATKGPAEDELQVYIKNRPKDLSVFPGIKDRRIPFGPDGKPAPKKDDSKVDEDDK